MSAAPGGSTRASSAPGRAAWRRPGRAAPAGARAPRRRGGRWLSLARLSLGQQMLLLAVLPATLAMMGAIGVLMRQYLDGMTDLVRANAQAVGLQLATAAQAPLAQTDRRALLRLAHSGISQPHVQQVQVWSDDGEILANAETQDRVRGEGLRVVVPVPAADARPLAGQVMVEMGLDAVASARRTVWLNVLLALGASLLGVILAAGWAARRISAPIRRLARAVDRLGAGEEAHVQIEGAAEVRRLQHGFNATAHALAEGRRLLQSRIETATAELARKNAQLEVASQAKTRLLAAASHDLRQPLHALTLFADGLANGETDAGKLQRIAHIRECVESLDRLFLELLNLSQLDAGVLQPQWADFPLDSVFDEISRNFRPVAEQQELRLVVRKTELWVRCDQVMLTRVLSNLVSNSLRHTVHGGVLVAARRRGRGVRVEVWDTGIGIAPEHQPRVFEEFYQVDPQQSRGTRGMGLGLATVQRLARLLNTRAELHSVPGQGTRVRMLVRAAHPPAQAGARPVRGPARPPPLALAPPVGDVRLDGLRILVIDDEAGILEGLQVALGASGATVLAAQCRDEALALADAWAAPPDVVVSDLLLRAGDNGLAVLAALRQHPRGIGAGTACLLVTGETQPERLREVAAAGVAVLYKPVSPRLLRQAIQAQVAARCGRPAHEA